MIILSSLLSQNLVNRNDYEKVVWLVNILKWLQRPRSEDEKSTKVETVYTVRIKYILSMLNNNPEWLENFVTTVSSLVYSLSSVSQYANAGFTSNSFVHEFVHRIQEKILPQWPFNEDLETLIYEVFPHEIESLYIDFVDETVLEEMLALFSRQSELHKKLRTDLLPEWKSECLEQCAALFVVGCRCDDGDIETTGLINHVVGDLWEDKLFFDAEVVIAATVEAAGVDASEITDAWQGNVDQLLEEGVHAFAAQCDFQTDWHSGTKFEVRDRLLRAGHNRFLQRDHAQFFCGLVHDLAVFFGFAQALVDHDFHQAWHGHWAGIVEFLLEFRHNIRNV